MAAGPAVGGDPAAGRDQEALAQLERLIEEHPLRQRHPARGRLELIPLGPVVAVASRPSSHSPPTSRSIDPAAFTWRASMPSSARWLIALSGIGLPSSDASTGPSSRRFIPIEWSVGVA